MSLRFVIVISAIVAITYSKPMNSDGGHSTSSRSQDDHGNYRFSYDITDNLGATNSRQESGDSHGNVVGSYSLNDIDGRSRLVKYIADKSGFRAQVRTNELGTSDQDSADAIYNSLDTNH